MKFKPTIDNFKMSRFGWYEVSGHLIDGPFEIDVVIRVNDNKLTDKLVKRGEFEIEVEDEILGIKSD